MITFATLFLGLILGPHQVELLVSGPVASIELILDGRSVGLLDAEPWMLECDFGDRLLPHELVAVARDARGDEIQRIRQWINLPRGRVEAELALEEIEEGRAAFARLVWQSLGAIEPERIEVRFNGVPIPPDGSGRYLLPAYDPQRIHLLTAELRFPNGLEARVERALGGRWGSDVTVEMTAVPLIDIRLPFGQTIQSVEGVLKRQGELLPVLAVEHERADIVVVLERSSLLALGGHGRMLDQQGGLRQERFELRRGEEIRFMGTTPQRELGRSVPYDLFAISRPFDSSDGSLPYLFSHISLESGANQQMADAVAVAGVEASARNRPRAVVLVLGHRWRDTSRFEVEQVESFLEALRVPLVVWSTGPAQTRTMGEDRRPLTTRTPWGAARDISSITRFLDAVAHLRQVLESQIVAWVEGSHLPTEISIGPRVKAPRPVPEPPPTEPLPEQRPEPLPVLFDLQPGEPVTDTVASAELPPPRIPPALSAEALLAEINRHRASLGRPFLRLSTELTQAAQRQADLLTAADDMEAAIDRAALEAEDLAAAGYRAHRWVQVAANSAATAEEVIAQWQKELPELHALFMEADIKDLGVGVGRANRMPLYSLVAALSTDDYLKPILAALDDRESVRRQILQHVNSERKRSALPGLALQHQLNRAAQRYAEAMRDGDFYGHQAPDGSTVMERVQSAGYRARRAGENLALGPESPQQAMEGWMASERHRDNILNRRFTEMGVGVAVGRDTDGEVRIYWVQCFGKPQ